MVEKQVNLRLLEIIDGKYTGYQANFDLHTDKNEQMPRYRRSTFFGAEGKGGNGESHSIRVPTSVIACIPERTKRIVTRGYKIDVNIADFAGYEDSQIEMSDLESDNMITTKRDQITRRMPDFCCMLRPAPGEKSLIAVNCHHKDTPLHRFYVLNKNGVYAPVKPTDTTLRANKVDLFPGDYLVFENPKASDNGPRYKLKLYNEAMFDKLMNAAKVKKANGNGVKAKKSSCWGFSLKGWLRKPAPGR